MELNELLAILQTLNESDRYSETRDKIEELVLEKIKELLEK